MNKEAEGRDVVTGVRSARRGPRAVKMRRLVERGSGGFLSVSGWTARVVGGPSARGTELSNVGLGKEAPRTGEGVVECVLSSCAEELGRRRR